MLTQFFNMYIITDCCQMVIGEVILSWEGSIING
jgi:hypothetical protein